MNTSEKIEDIARLHSIRLSPFEITSEWQGQGGLVSSSLPQFLLGGNNKGSYQVN